MKFGVAYCLYDDHEYLEASLAPLEQHLDRILFVMSERPWNGAPSDNSATVAAVGRICQRLPQARFIRGVWDNEVPQRNFALDLLQNEGIDYCLIVDTDEIYHAHHIPAIKSFIIQNQNYSAFHIEWNTYWKKSYHRITPREEYRPVIAVSTRDFVFNRIREGITAPLRLGPAEVSAPGAYRGVLIPPQVAICYHLSYARSNSYIQRKLETNSHAQQFMSDWYQKVWLPWTPESKNLHPVIPTQYDHAEAEIIEHLPESLRKFIEAERGSSL